MVAVASVDCDLITISHDHTLEPEDDMQNDAQRTTFLPAEAAKRKENLKLGLNTYPLVATSITSRTCASDFVGVFNF